MANSINLGTFPYYGGTPVQDNSIYLGDNRFLRIGSQRNADATIAVMYESSNVLDNNASIVALAQEVLLPGMNYDHFKVVQLGDGRFVIVGSPYGRSDLYATVFEFDDQSNKFNVIATFNMTGSWDLGNSSTINRLRYYGSGHKLIVQPYGERSFLMCGAASSHIQYVRVDIDETGTDITTTELHTTNNSTEANNFDAAGANSKIIDDHWFVRTGFNYSSCGNMFDLSVNSIEYIRNSYVYDVLKMAEGRYVYLRFSSRNITFKLTNNVSDVSGSYLSLNPVVRIAASDVTTGAANFIVHPIDAYYAIVFDGNNWTQSDYNTLYARIVHFLDENYAFVSENSNDIERGVPITTALTTNASVRSRYLNGQYVHQIDAQTYYVQTGYNTFEFFTFAT